MDGGGNASHHDLVYLKRDLSSQCWEPLWAFGTSLSLGLSRGEVSLGCLWWY